MSGALGVMVGGAALIGPPAAWIAWTQWQGVKAATTSAADRDRTTGPGAPDETTEDRAR